MDLFSILIGRRLANEEGRARKITAIEGVPAMRLDGLGSSAYGPEAALTILIPLGAGGLHLIQPIMAAILVLLALLYFSNRQTIEAYPNNGGSYIVAKDNLGANAGLLAASALMIDYVLNVAVGISAGIGAFTSAVPQLHPYTLELCLAVLALITIVNLKGTLEAGVVFSVPTYLFVASLGGVLLFGMAKALAMGGHPAPVVAPPPLPPATQMVTLWLLLRAFASGCTAMTGIEAVSNGVSAFQDPAVKHAHCTLTAIVLILGFFARRDFLALSRLRRPRDGRNPAGLSERPVSADRRNRWTRRDLFHRDRQPARGPVSVGQYELCRFSEAVSPGSPGRLSAAQETGLFGRHIVVGGHGRTAAHRVRWHHRPADPAVCRWRIHGLHLVAARDGVPLGARTGNRGRLWINGTGAAGTGLALAIILSAKFIEGAWITVLVIPLVLGMLKTIKRHYELIDRQLREEGPIDLRGLQPPIVLFRSNVGIGSPRKRCALRCCCRARSLRSI